MNVHPWLTPAACVLLASAAAAQPPRDIHGDGLPEGAAARYGTVRLRHPRHAWVLAISPDRSRLACTDGLNRLLMWQLPSGRRLWAARCARGPQALIFTADGRTVAAAVPAAGIVLYDANAGTTVHTFAAKDPAVGQSLLTSPDGGRLFAAGRSVSIYDLAARRQSGELGGHRGAMDALALSPDGKSLAAGGFDSDVWVWDWATGRNRLRLPLGEKAPVAALSFSSDGKLLAAGHRGWSEPVHNDARTAIIRQIPHPPAVVVWDVAGGKPAGRIDGAGYPHFVANAGRGLLYVARCIGGASWVLARADPATGETRPTGIPLGQRWAWSDDGKVLAVASSEFGLDLLGMPEGNSLLGGLPGHHNAVGCLAISPDGRTVVTGHGMTSSPWPEKHAAFVWNAADGRIVREMGDANSGTITAVEFSPDGRLLAAGFHDGSVSILDAADWRVLSKLPVAVPAATRPAGQRRLTPIRFVGWVGRSGRIVVSDYLGATSLWDAMARRKLADLELAGGGEGPGPIVVEAGGKRTDGRGGPLLRLALWPDGGSVLVVSQNAAEIRTLVGGEPLVRMPLDKRGFVQCCAVSPDGLLAVAGDHSGTLHVWEAATGLPVATIRGQHKEHAIYGLAVSPDGRLIATAGARDRTVRLWDVARRVEVKAFTGHEADVYCVAFTPDGKSVVSGSADCTALRWRLDIPPPPAVCPAAAAMEKAWEALADANGAAGWHAQRTLLLDRPAATKLLAARVQPVRPEAAAVARWVAQLAAPTAAARASAEAELAALGAAVESDLRKALREAKSAEAGARLEGLLAALAEHRVPAAPVLRMLRAVAVLRAIARDGAAARAPGGEEARAALARLAAGHAASAVTRAAASGVRP